jgi:hypothetical protein
MHPARHVHLSQRSPQANATASAAAIICLGSRPQERCG